MNLSAIAAPDGIASHDTWTDDGEGVHRRRVTFAEWVGEDYFVEVVALQIAKYSSDPDEIGEAFVSSPDVMVWTGEADHPSVTLDTAIATQLLAQQVMQAADTVMRFHYFGVEAEPLELLADDLLKAANFMADYAKWEQR